MPPISFGPFSGRIRNSNLHGNWILGGCETDLKSTEAGGPRTMRRTSPGRKLVRYHSINMNALRRLYIKTTDLTHGYKGNPSKLASLYKLWSPLYDTSIKMDPAYNRNLKRMVFSAVSKNDSTLDIGCGTGIGTIHASKIARRVLGIDPSKDMLHKLQTKIRKQSIENIEIRNGFFPQSLKYGERFGSIISSFMLAHLSRSQQMQAVIAMFDILEPGGKIGLFSAQGEIAPTFQTRKELTDDLSSAGFSNYYFLDLDDIYRITIAKKSS
jgi:ubiquinone/menaquinone biosynthesis C-methylase UbiE